MQLPFEKPSKTKKRKKKAWTKQRTRKHYINAICDLWAILVKNRDKHTCQFTGRTDKQLHAHHIVSKGTLKGKLAGYFDLNNGITLSSYEHKQAHQGEPDVYIEKRDKWLKSQGLEYKPLKDKLMMRTKYTLGDLGLIFWDFCRKVKECRIYQEQIDKIYTRWIKPMEKAGVL